MAQILNDPVRRLQTLSKDRDRRFIIGLSGVPGSGKTTIAARWAQALETSAGGAPLTVLGLDGFHLPRAALRAMPNPSQAFARRGAPWTFDPGAIASALEQLRRSFRQADVHWPGFEHDVGDPAPGAITVGPDAALIMVEGIYTAQAGPDWSRVSGCFDEQWYLDVPWHEAAPRLIARHRSAWGMTHEDAVRRAESNDRLNAALVFLGRDRADWIVRPER